MRAFLQHRARLMFITFVLGFVAGCASLGAVTPQTFAERLVYAKTSVTATRSTALTLLNAGKITAADAQHVQTGADVARQGITIAEQMHATNPAAGDAKLANVVAGLNLLSSYLATQQKGSP